MAFKETVQSILKVKGGSVSSVSPESTVFQALSLMAEKDVGALLVVSNDELVGMFSERDYARKIILHGKSSKDTLVREVMSSPVVTVTAERTVDECMRLMTHYRVRHLPVCENGRVVGVVSIGDLVSSIFTAQAETIQQLSSYIAGRYPG